MDDSKVDMDKYLEILENRRTCIMLKPHFDMDSITDLDDIYIDDTEHYKPWTLNEDITCPHGNLSIAKETTRLVPEEIEKMLKI